MVDLETYERFWEEAVILLLHPTQLLILEALTRLEMPVSATAMVEMSDGQISLAYWTYHLTRLEKLGLLKLVKARPSRGTPEKFYDLRLVKAD